MWVDVLVTVDLMPWPQERREQTAVGGLRLEEAGGAEAYAEGNKGKKNLGSEGSFPPEVPS